MNTLEQISKCPAVCGCENLMQELLTKKLLPGSYKDNCGNVIYHISGKGEKIIFAVPMDTPGAYVTFIDQNGFIRFSKVGSFDFAPGMSVLIKGSKSGVIFEDKEKNLFIDIGAKSALEAEKFVSVSDFISLSPRYMDLGEYILSCFIGNRAAMTALIAASSAESGKDVYFVFVSKTANNQISPVFLKDIGADKLITIESCAANDIPEQENIFLKLDEGAVVTVKNASCISSPELLDEIYSASKNIKIQKEVSDDKGIGAALQTAYSGIKCAGIGLPVRYKGTYCEMISLNDLDNLTQLIKNLMK